MVMDFRNIKATWRKYDHSDLNTVFTMPTAEMIATAIYADINKASTRGEEGPLPLKIDYVRVWESDDAYAEVS